jgi:hypothetical protein
MDHDCTKALTWLVSAHPPTHGTRAREEEPRFPFCLCLPLESQSCWPALFHIVKKKGVRRTITLLIVFF